MFTIRVALLAGPPLFPEACAGPASCEKPKKKTAVMSTAIPQFIPSFPGVIFFPAAGELVEFKSPRPLFHQDVQRANSRDGFFFKSSGACLPSAKSPEK